MQKVGDFVYDPSAGRRVQIVKVADVWGFVTYTVFDEATGRGYKLSAEAAQAKPVRRKKNEDYLRYVATLCQIKNEVSEGILTKLSRGILPLPHQMYALKRAVSENRVRYILADEVGLGKTIEAGLIIEELKARGLVQRVLVVCPTGLVTQWHLEMQEKFGEDFKVILPADYKTIRKLTGKEDVYSQFDRVISPMDAIKPLDKRKGWTQEQIDQYNKERVESLVESGWDLVIIDEAHRVAGSTNDVARYKLGSLLAKASPYLLLLTATPHNGKTDPFLRLIRMLDDKAFPNTKSVVKSQVAPYVIRTEKREAIDHHGQPLFKKRHTHVVALHWDERYSLQAELYRQVSQYVRKNYNKALRSSKNSMWFIFLLIMMQRMVTSSTRAIRESLERRVRFLEGQEESETMPIRDAEALDEEEMAEQALSAEALNEKEELQNLRELISLAKGAESQYPDVKMDPLLQMVDTVIGRDKAERILIFTEFVATQAYLRDVLVKRGYTVTCLNGSLNMEERNQVLEDFRDRKQILVATDAGGEGLNLQFAHCVINYDLPWNPMKIEQRIGRVDRIGQQKDVEVYNFTLADTVESRVQEVLKDKLSVILQELGIDKYADVLDSEAAEVNFTQAYINTIRHPKDLESNVYPIEKDMRQQMEQSQQIRDLIQDTKDLQSFAGSQMSFDVDAALHHMMVFYSRYHGSTVLPLDSYSLNDSRITAHLQKTIMQEPTDPVLHVTIDRLPHETGYFMLWHLSVSADETKGKILPIFINEEGVLRPLAGKRLWEAMLDESYGMRCREGGAVSQSMYDSLVQQSQKYAYDFFLDMKAQDKKNKEESYQRYMYAMKLRMEAAGRIAIENIRKHKMDSLQKEAAAMEAAHQREQQICPSFRMVLLVRMEAP